MTPRALRIGAIEISIESEERFDVPDATSRFFVAPSDDPDVVIRVERGQPAAPHGEVIFDSGEVWRLYRDGNRNVFTFSAPDLAHDPYRVASFNDDFTRGDVTLSDSVPRGLDPLAYPLDELLVATLLARGAGVELHGFGMIIDGRGYLFAGQSGAGKTTTSRLWLEHSPEILSDDRLIIRKDGDGFRMYGTPWHGEAEISSPGDAPLAAIFLLEQSPRSEVREIDSSEAIARLFGCTFPLFYDGVSLAFTLGFLGELVTSGLVRVLDFRPDASAVAAVREHSLFGRE